MKYKYELHTHTGPVSLCASIDPRDLVEIYYKNGYNGLVLTDHYSPMTFYKNMLCPQKYVDDYLKSYNMLKDYCRNDFTVLLGIELRHWATVNDYLVYGVSENWLANQKNMLIWDEKKMSEEVHRAGYLVYQAHPYRPLITQCDTNLLDGIEVFNGHTKPEENLKAYNRAIEYNMPMISGSDFHTEKDTPCGGIFTDTKISNNKELLQVLKSGKYEIINPHAVASVPDRV